MRPKVKAPQEVHEYALALERGARDPMNEFKERGDKELAELGARSELLSG